MRVLMITTEYPTPQQVGLGIFVARQVEALRAAGVEVDVLHFWSRANPLNHLRAWFKMRQMIAQKHYDLIHAQFGHSALIGRMQFRLPIVVTYHGDELQGIVGKRGRYHIKGLLLILLCQVMAFLVNEVIVVSEAMGRCLLRRDYHLIPSGVDLDRFHPMPRDEVRRILGWPADARTVLFAVLDLTSPRKRFSLAKAAVERITQELPVELCAGTNIQPEQMPLYMNAADVLLLTSLHEGSPTVVKEAMACNLPVVTVDVGDVTERLAGVSHSYVCDATPEALAEGLHKVLCELERSNGREAVAGLAEPLLAQNVIAIYQQMVGRNA